MHSIDVLVVGAGLGGLAAALALKTAGHRVTVIDAAPEFSKAGAGIHIPPNASRLLSRWGVDIGGLRTICSGYRFIRYADGKPIAGIPFDNILEADGARYHIVHRADLHGALLDAARRVGCTILTGKRVVEYDFNVPEARTVDGSTFGADLVVAADGMRSIARPLLTGAPDAPRDIGDVAYRINIPAEKLRADPELSALVCDPCVTFWCGPEAHVVGHPIRDGAEYNIMICARSRDSAPGLAWAVEGGEGELLARFSGWEPRVRTLCSMADTFLKWRLCDVPDVPTWVHSSSRACLLGDACHPMLPYLAQGAAMAFEDAAVLKQCLASENDLTSALLLYEQTRMPRVSHVQEETREHQHVWHVEDGWRQALRDGQMARNTTENPVFWGEEQRRHWLFGHDAELVGKQGYNWNGGGD